MHPTKWINDTITTTGADGYSHVTTVQMLQKGSILKIWEVAINWVAFKVHILRLTVKKPKHPAFPRHSAFRDTDDANTMTG